MFRGGRVCGSCEEWVGGELLSWEQTLLLCMHAKTNLTQTIINLKFNFMLIIACARLALPRTRGCLTYAYYRRIQCFFSSYKLRKDGSYNVGSSLFLLVMEVALEYGNSNIFLPRLIT